MNRMDKIINIEDEKSFKKCIEELTKLYQELYINKLKNDKFKEAVIKIYGSIDNFPKDCFKIVQKFNNKEIKEIWYDIAYVLRELYNAVDVDTSVVKLKDFDNIVDEYHKKMNYFYDLCSMSFITDMISLVLMMSMLYFVIDNRIPILFRNTINKHDIISKSRYNSLSFYIKTCARTYISLLNYNETDIDYKANCELLSQQLDEVKNDPNIIRKVDFDELKNKYNIIIEQPIKNEAKKDEAEKDEKAEIKELTTKDELELMFKKLVYYHEDYNLPVIDYDDIKNKCESIYNSIKDDIIRIARYYRDSSYTGNELQKVLKDAKIILEKIQKYDSDEYKQIEAMNNKYKKALEDIKNIIINE